MRTVQRRARVGAVAIVALVLLAVALTSCATVEPRVQTVTNEVKVQVPVPCIKDSDIPPLPGSAPLAAGATTDQRVAALRADLKALRGYAALADPLLRKCATP